MFEAPLPPVPPVTPQELAELEPVVVKGIETVIENGADLGADVSAARRWAKADKTGAVAAASHVAVLLIMALVMHLPANDVAELGALVAAFNAYFTVKPKA